MRFELKASVICTPHSEREKSPGDENTRLGHDLNFGTEVLSFMCAIVRSTSRPVKAVCGHLVLIHKHKTHTETNKRWKAGVAVYHPGPHSFFKMPAIDVSKQIDFERITQGTAENLGNVLPWNIIALDDQSDYRYSRYSLRTVMGREFEMVFFVIMYCKRIAESTTQL